MFFLYLKLFSVAMLLHFSQVLFSLIFFFIFCSRIYSAQNKRKIHTITLHKVLLCIRRFLNINYHFIVTAEQIKHIFTDLPIQANIIKHIKRNVEKLITRSTIIWLDYFLHILHFLDFENFAVPYSKKREKKCSVNMQATMKLRVVEYLLEIAYFFCILCLYCFKMYHKMKFESK